MNEESTRLAAYLPEGGDLLLKQLPGRVRNAQALDPLSVNPIPVETDGNTCYRHPQSLGSPPQDWILLLSL